ncbi:MAG TPA: cytochrome C oxidase subunit IV family protein [Planctomycetota bacterium]|jgi:cytochrome c oxidase subunit 4|nr:cytochrome C oxidase subunit IV family protein [Planctomycetota bacterium]
MGHVASLRLYLAVFLVLILGTALTVAASELNLGRPGNITLALLIASAKASCVAAFFMHLKWDRGWIWLFVLYPLALFCVLTFALWPDIAFRAGDAVRFLGGAR